MLKKIGAVLLAVGLFLPYGPARIIAIVWQGVPTILFSGVPVLITIAYVLHSFVPPLAQFHQRYGQGLHGLFRVVFFVLAGAYLAMSLAKEHAGWPAHLHVIVALVVTGGLLYWGQGRGTKAERLPLLLLICAGIPTIAYFLDAVHAGELLYGGGRSCWGGGSAGGTGSPEAGWRATVRHPAARCAAARPVGRARGRRRGATRCRDAGVRDTASPPAPVPRSSPGTSRPPRRRCGARRR